MLLTLDSALLLAKREVAAWPFVGGLARRSFSRADPRAWPVRNAAIAGGSGTTRSAANRRGTTLIIAGRHLPGGRVAVGLATVGVVELARRHARRRAGADQALPT
ncbi:hypothetical protein [Amycolatopsis magusensis]|uniref:hypothetical protein n=1 Tax=Amycolatopsis magusensis TaxID=882444 RepID=UPI0037BD93C0